MLAYEELTEAEQAIWNAIQTGAPVALPLGAPAPDDPAEGKAWGEDRQIRAQLLYELLADTSGTTVAQVRHLRLRGARITGRLDLEAATLRCPVSFQNCFFEEPIVLNLARAVSIRLSGCHLPGFAAQQLETRGNLNLDGGFTVDYGVDLGGARIGGNLVLADAKLHNPAGSVLNGDRLTVTQRMACEGLQADGGVQLSGAHIGGALGLNGAKLRNHGSDALVAYGLIVDESMLCSDGFEADGAVRLFGAHIAGLLDFNGAKLRNQGDLALAAYGLTVGRLMRCGQGFQADGAVRLPRARLGGLLDSEDSWPRELRLDGLVYDQLAAEPPVTVSRRLGWLRRDPAGYIPQPYEQLAAAYQGAGQPEQARIVLIAKQWDRRQSLRNPLGKAWNWLLCATVGYGYLPWLAGVWLAALVVFGDVAFARARDARLLDPARDSPDQQPTFHSAGYALDLLLPIVNLGQDGAWIPRGWAVYWSWGFILMGWVLTTAVVRPSPVFSNATDSFGVNRSGFTGGSVA
jgi:hypothetical protein